MHQLSPDLFVAVGMGSDDIDPIVTSHPQAIQHILTNDRKQFAALSSEIIRPLLGSESMFTIVGKQHRRRRQLVMPAFHGERLSVYGELIQRLTQKVFQRLVPGEIFSARKVTQQISLQVIFEVVFGLYQGERATQIRELLTVTTNQFSSPAISAMLFFPQLQKDWGSWSPWGKFLRIKAELQELIYVELKARRQNPDPNRKDILSLLMAARDESGEAMRDRELHDELITLLWAGHETAATAMAWSLYWIHRKPAVREKLLKELNSLGNAPDAIAIAKLPYLTAVCQETLRRSPIVMFTFPRMAQEPLECLGYQFSAGTIFLCSPYLTLQREELYPAPEEFRPERFLEKQYSPYEFMPFGNGSRRCVGDALAQYEMKLVLATILQEHQLELADTKPERARRSGPILAPERGVKMRIIS